MNLFYRHLRHNKSERIREDDGHATFEDFANYLLTIDVMNCDPHFRSYLAQCKPCDVNYDFIIKFETIEKDMEYLKQVLNLSDYHKKAVFPNVKFHTSAKMVKSTFEKIPKNLSRSLFTKYQKDFEIFGYKKPDWL